jgi:chemotaxis protein CheX
MVENQFYYRRAYYFYPAKAILLLRQSVRISQMMGRPVDTIDDMAKSAVCELVNMIVSHASTSLNQTGFAVKINPPSFLQGNTKVKVCNSTYIGIEMIVDNCPIEISMGLNAE